MALVNMKKTNKSLSPTILFLLILLLVSTKTESKNVEDGKEEKPTAYEMLGEFNFPQGILPKGVLGYEFNNETGKFSAFFDGSCSFSLEGSYQLKYKSRIKGVIARDKLRSLEGVSVKLFFLWVDIVEVSRQGDDIQFSVGIAGAGFPIDNFYESPQCGCGFDCVATTATHPLLASS